MPQSAEAKQRFYWLFEGSPFRRPSATGLLSVRLLLVTMLSTLFCGADVRHKKTRRPRGRREL
jgi:hypothetical protein